MAKSIKKPSNARAELIFPGKFAVSTQKMVKRTSREWNTFIKKLDFEEKGKILNIQLTNGCVFKGPAPQKKWNLNDQIFINVLHDIELENASCSDSLKVTLRNQDSLVTARVEKYSNKAHNLTLTDGSVWFVGKFAKQWNSGDRIVVAPLESPNFDMTTHILLNLDLMNEKCTKTQSATLIK